MLYRPENVLASIPFSARQRDRAVTTRTHDDSRALPHINSHARALSFRPLLGAS